MSFYDHVYYYFQPYRNDYRKTSKERPVTNLGYSQPSEFSSVDIHKLDGQLLDNVVEYNKNLTDDEVNGTSISNILKYDNLMLLSEFDKMLVAQQYRKLYGKTREANDLLEEDFESQIFMNLPLSQIVENFGISMKDIFEQLPNIYAKGKIDWKIFTKDDRLTYVGIFFILLAFIFYCIFISS